jgi:hypothetical protein
MHEALNPDPARRPAISRRAPRERTITDTLMARCENT